MIVPDVNLLVYAYNRAAPRHDDARAWWEATLSSRHLVGLPWVSALGFIRLTTHPRVTPSPLTGARAAAIVGSWLGRSHVRPLVPGPRHLALLEAALADLGVAGRLTTDAHLAALAIEHDAELHSNDADFARFQSLRWRNPLA